MVGTFYMLIDGIIGTICLVVTTCQGGGLYDLTGSGFALLMIAAVFAYSGIVILGYTIGIGIAGIISSIYNANAFIHVLLSAIFLH